MTTADPMATLTTSNPIADAHAIVDPEVMERTRRAIVATTFPASSGERRRRLWSRPAVAAIAAGVAVIAGLTLTSTDHGPGTLPGVVSALADAIEQPGAVLHTTNDGPHVADAGGGPAIIREESWVSLDGTIQRTRTTYADGSFQDLRFERRDDRYRITVYRSATNALSTAPWLKLHAPPTDATTGQLNLTTIQDYAQAVDAGHARLDGTTQINGHDALRVIDTSDGPAHGTVWLVATDTDTPTLLAIQPPCRDSGACRTQTTYADYNISDDRSGLSLPDYPDAHAARAPSANKPAPTTTAIR